MPIWNQRAWITFSLPFTANEIRIQPARNLGFVSGHGLPTTGTTFLRPVIRAQVQIAVVVDKSSPNQLEEPLPS
jgi:hypothetical protein